ncbi:MAG: hypothetical protein R3F59_37300, partial [Myxococcota bacterium]
MRARKVLGCMGASVVALLALGAVGGAVGIVWVGTDGGERQVVRWVNRALDNAVETGAVRIGDLDVGWHHLVLHDVEIDGAEHHGVVVIPEIAARFELRPLLQKLVHVTELDIVRPRVDLQEGADGLDLPTFASSGQPTPPDQPTTYLPAGLALTVDRARIVDGSIAVPSAEVALDGLDVEAALRADHKAIVLDRLLAMWQQQQPSLGPVLVSLDGAVVNDDLEQLRAEIGVRGARARLEGSADGVTDPVNAALDLRAAVTADAASREALADAFGQQIPASIADAPPLTVAVDLGGGPAATTAALSAWWVDTPTLATEALLQPVVTARVDGARQTPWSAAFDVDVPSLAELEPLQLPVSRGDLHVSGAAGEGDGGAITGHATVTGHDVVASDVRVASLSVPVRVTLPQDGAPQVVGSLAVQGVRATDAARIAELSGDYDLAFGDQILGTASLRTRSLDLGHDGQIQLRGDLAVHLAPDQVRLDSTWIDRRSDDRRMDVIGRMNTVSGDVQVDELMIRTSPDVVWRNPDPITTTYTDGGLRDLHLVLESPEGRLHVEGKRIASGDIDLGAEAKVSLAHVRAVAQPFVAQDLPSLAGELSARADVSIGDGRPPALLALVRGEGLTVADQVRDADLVVHARVAGDRAEATASVAAQGDDAAGPLVTAEVAVPLAPGGTSVQCDGDLAALVELPGAGWDALRGVVPALPALPEQLQELSLGGKAWAVGKACDPSTSLVANVDTALSDRPVHLTLGLHDDAAADATDVGMVAALAGSPALQAKATAAHPDVAAWLQSDDPAGQIGAWTAQARLLGVPVDVALDQAKGQLFGHAAAEGEGTRLGRTDGGVTWYDAVVNDLALHDAHATWDTSDDALKAELNVALDRTDGLAAEAEVGLSALQDLAADAPVKARITRGELPLQVVGALSGGAIVDASGIARVTGTVDGTLADPQADVDLAVRNGAFTVADTGVRYSRLRVTGKVDGRTLTLDHGRMASRPRYGRFAVTEGDDIDARLSGTVTMDAEHGIAPDLRIRLNEFWALANNTGLLKTSGDLHVGGSLTDLDVTGKVAVDEGRFDLQRSLFLSSGASNLDPDIV